MTLWDQILLYGPGFIAGAAVAIQCAALSALVVLRRLSFVGQGISHAAFGGIGLALLLGLTAFASYGVIAAFCAVAALGIAWMSGRRAAAADTVIGVVLVGSMALGAILVSLRHRLRADLPPAPPWDDLLFGSIMSVGWQDALIGWGAAIVVLCVLIVVRRPLLFYAFDTQAAEASGVRTGLMQAALMILLAVATVVAMKLAGVVLATATLVLPGATALRLSDRLGRVLALSGAAALIGVLGGLALAIALDLPPGATMVGVLVALYGASWAVAPLAKLQSTLRGAPPTGAPATTKERS